ncbi:hypothetical protein CLOSTASPAR_02308 [[Clostridium] asparagiforme DSM 15981]|uniref:Uncharacterized protein n=1 Tax=[Clostridium] asparagiforme DSM 15981 TaxID=518636 RepID=C0CZ82_9FIRM|nr:hypothetical protein CLOSTASPAR_02308 [[Clostridium] asparagiforme DSM 15981]
MGCGTFPRLYNKKSKKCNIISDIKQKRSRIWRTKTAILGA